MFLRNFVQRVKNYQLLITNTLANGSLLAGGDFVVQRIERYHKSDENGSISNGFIDWKRSARFFLTGFCIGPALHGWYTLLDTRFSIVNGKNVAIKVLFDQIIAGPVCVSYFYIATSLLEGKTLLEAFRELKRKFVATFMVDCTVYPLAQTVNFFIVPPRFRVIFVSTCTFFYSIFLSFIKTSEGKGKEFIEFVNDLFGL